MIFQNTSFYYKSYLTCQNNDQCDYLYYCDQKNQICNHEGIFDMGYISILSYILIPLIVGIANAGGQGGGIVKVPILILLLNYSTQFSTQIAYPITLGGCMANIFLLLNQKHPTKDKPLIDFGIAIILVPALLIGTNIGVIMNQFLPDLILQIFFIIFLSIVCPYLIKRAINLYKLEKQLKQDLLQYEQQIQQDLTEKNDQQQQKQISEIINEQVKINDNLSQTLLQKNDINQVKLDRKLSDIENEVRQIISFKNLQQNNNFDNNSNDITPSSKNKDLSPINNKFNQNLKNQSQNQSFILMDQQINRKISVKTQDLIEKCQITLNQLDDLMDENDKIVQFRKDRLNTLQPYDQFQLQNNFQNTPTNSNEKLQVIEENLQKTHRIKSLGYQNQNPVVSNFQNQYLQEQFQEQVKNYNQKGQKVDIQNKNINLQQNLIQLQKKQSSSKTISENKLSEIKEISILEQSQIINQNNKNMESFNIKQIQKQEEISQSVIFQQDYINKITKEESQKIPLKKLGILIISLITIVFFTLVLGSDSIFGFNKCDEGYWVFFILQFLVLLIISLASWMYMQREICQKQLCKYEFEEQELQELNFKSYLKLSLSGFFAGFIGGMLGTGAGLVIVPVLLILNLNAKVAAATSGFMYFFISFSSILQVLLAKQASLEIMGWYIGLALLGGSVISPAVYWYVNKYKKQSLVIIIVFFIALLNIVCSIFYLIKQSNKYGFDYLNQFKDYCYYTGH